MKTKKELNALKKEIETLNEKLAELSDGGNSLANRASGVIKCPAR